MYFGFHKKVIEFDQLEIIKKIFGIKKTGTKQQKYFSS